MRNYQLKLEHQEEVRNKTAEVEALERRRTAVMNMEAQPTFAQLYLHIDSIGNGGISIDRENNKLEIPEDLLHEPVPSEDGSARERPSVEDLNLP